MIYELRRDISAICAALMYVDASIPLPYLISSIILAHRTYVVVVVVVIVVVGGGM